MSFGVVLPWIDFNHLLDTAFEQIRHYSAGDVAVSLRLLRALHDLAATIDDERMREELTLRGRRIVANCAGRLDPSDLRRLEERLARLGSPRVKFDARHIALRRVKTPARFSQ